MSKSHEEYRNITEKFFEEGQVQSSLNGAQPVFVILGYNDVQTLEGKLLTLLDASFADKEQRKAVKDLLRQSIWWQWVPSLDHGPNKPSGGMPVNTFRE